jgi:hypothetical protein
MKQLKDFMGPLSMQQSTPNMLCLSSASSMREAMQLGVTHVGGLDSTLVDVDMEKSLQTMVQITVDYKPRCSIKGHCPRGAWIWRSPSILEAIAVNGKGRAQSPLRLGLFLCI